MPGDPRTTTRASAPTIRRVRAAILAWYAREHRDYPWRRTRDPWAVLVSEVMLQQTQAARVAQRFDPFMDRFPTPGAMASAGEADVLAAWTGMGYNRRALSLRRAASEVEAQGWPTDVAGLQALPGIGPYTARAVAALAFGVPVGAVDTNVRRWLVRRFGLGAAAPAATLQALADSLALAGPTTSAAESAAWMHASMEFGARVCASRKPLCDLCPVAVGCPSAGRAVHVPVPRQAAFAGSERELRGALVRTLAARHDHRLMVEAARRALGLEERRLEELAAGLARDGLVHRDGKWLVLGGVAATVTIRG